MLCWIFDAFVCVFHLFRLDGRYSFHKNEVQRSGGVLLKRIMKNMSLSSMYGIVQTSRYSFESGPGNEYIIHVT